MYMTGVVENGLWCMRITGCYEVWFPLYFPSLLVVVNHLFYPSPYWMGAYISLCALAMSFTYHYNDHEKFLFTVKIVK